MKAWEPKRREAKWRHYLTADEQASVAEAEAASVEAKERLAAATAILNPIRQRASHRALNAERSGGR